MGKDIYHRQQLRSEFQNDTKQIGREGGMGMMFVSPKYLGSQCFTPGSGSYKAPCKSSLPVNGTSSFRLTFVMFDGLVPCRAWVRKKICPTPSLDRLTGGVWGQTPLQILLNAPVPGPRPARRRTSPWRVAPPVIRTLQRAHRTSAGTAIWWVSFSLSREPET
jgi:hypothetical protein